MVGSFSSSSDEKFQSPGYSQSSPSASLPTSLSNKIKLNIVKNDIHQILDLTTTTTTSTSPPSPPTTSTTNNLTNPKITVNNLNLNNLNNNFKINNNFNNNNNYDSQNFLSKLISSSDLSQHKKSFNIKKKKDSFEEEEEKDFNLNNSISESEELSEEKTAKKNVKNPEKLKELKKKLKNVDSQKNASDSDESHDDFVNSDIEFDILDFSYNDVLLLNSEDLIDIVLLDEFVCSDSFIQVAQIYSSLAKKCHFSLLSTLHLDQLESLSRLVAKKIT